MNRALTYDDVNIVPKYSELESLEKVKLNTRFTKNTELSIPIVASPMDTITEYDMALEMMKWGGAGIVHRFMSIDEQVDIMNAIYPAIKASNQVYTDRLKDDASWDSYIDKYMPYAIKLFKHSGKKKLLNIKKQDVINFLDNLQNVSLKKSDIRKAA